LPLNRSELVIFDCDGVLVDSEPISIGVLLELIAEAGGDIGEAVAYERFLGRSVATINGLLRDEFGLVIGDAEIERMRAAIFRRFREELKPIPGIRETLMRLEGKRAVASSSQLDRIRLSLEVTGLGDLLEPHIYSASMVARGKPAPDLFLHVAHDMGVAPGNCTVIEDSPAGIAAAKAAGMRVFGFAGGAHAGGAGLAAALEKARPDLIFDDMRRLPELLGESGGALSPLEGEMSAKPTEGVTSEGTAIAPRIAEVTPSGRFAAISPSRGERTPASQYVCAVDVGTGSARAGILDAGGRLAGRGEHPIVMNRPRPGHAEHDSEDVWRAVCRAVQGALAASRVDPADVAGISFDATCSLVVRDLAGAQLGVSTAGGERWDTIVWLDHRALAEADACTATGHAVLGHLGGVMSPEMQTPKLMWIRKNLPDVWSRAGFFFDLADFLTWKASGSNARSQCTLACKWTYLAHEEPGWRQDFFNTVGIGDMLARGGLPERASLAGTDLGPLTPQAAAALGLTTGCRVGVGLVDAYAGTLGVLAGFAGDPATVDRHLALIAGTSSCVMAMAPEPRSFAGVWGPYFGVTLPELWMCEGGQSATGALLDHLIRWHAAGGEPDAAMHGRIAARIMELKAAEGPDFAGRLHVLPDFHGNRSPLADPHAVGVVSGLTLDASFDSLCRLYWRSAVGIALGVRHILDALNERGFLIDTLHVTGGHTRNPLLMELYADATGCAVVEPQAPDAVLLGTAMLAATAGGIYPDLASACAAMQQGGVARMPNPAARARFDRDYRIFLEMHRQRRVLDAMR
jgi:FGGY-family pentulose kinase/HAD superfamily hydrolase (TIGR01509 family)